MSTQSSKRNLVSETKNVTDPETLDTILMTATNEGHIFTSAELSHAFAVATQSPVAILATAVQSSSRLPTRWTKPNIQTSSQLLKQMYNWMELQTLFDIAADPNSIAREAERIAAKYSKALNGMGADDMTIEDEMQVRVLKVAACVRQGCLYVMELRLKGWPPNGWVEAVPTVYVRETKWITDDQREKMKPFIPKEDPVESDGDMEEHLPIIMGKKKSRPPMPFAPLPRAQAPTSSSRTTAAYHTVSRASSPVKSPSSASIKTGSMRGTGSGSMTLRGSIRFMRQSLEGLFGSPSSDGKSAQ